MDRPLKIGSPTITQIDKNHALVELTVSDADDEKDATITLRIRLPTETYSAAPHERIHLDALVEAFSRLRFLEVQVMKSIGRLRNG